MPRASKSWMLVASPLIERNKRSSWRSKLGDHSIKDVYNADLMISARDAEEEVLVPKLCTGGVEFKFMD